MRPEHYKITKNILLYTTKPINPNRFIEVYRHREWTDDTPQDFYYVVEWNEADVINSAVTSAYDDPKLLEVIEAAVHNCFPEYLRTTINIKIYQILKEDDHNRNLSENI